MHAFSLEAIIHDLYDIILYKLCNITRVFLVSYLRSIAVISGRSVCHLWLHHYLNNDVWSKRTSKVRSNICSNADLNKILFVSMSANMSVFYCVNFFYYRQLNSTL